MKDAMFQFYDGKKMADDTGLIELDEAIKMFNDRKSVFADALSRDLKPHMAIWVNCNSNSDYHTTIKDWCAGDVKYEDGCFWVRELIYRIL